MSSDQTNLSLPDLTPLPTGLASLEGLDLHARYYSARTGGDFFDALIVGPHLVFLLADIAGARASAHTIATSAQGVLRLRAPEIFGDPAANLMDAIVTLAQDINHSIIHASNGVRFAPTFLGCFDLALGVLTYINAGGQPAVFRDSEGVRILGTICVPLGLFTHLTYEPAIQAFEPGASLLLVTKGVVEARRGRTHFGVDRLTNLLQGDTAVTALDLCQTTLQQAHQFRKIPWFSLQNLHLTRPERIEDLTAVALIRPAIKTP
jgi:serine phosphatase RsbU (regulator of sigma subunit)